jgi:transcriptional regulator with XRE-family HTH domain
MTTPAGPIIHRRRLGAELRQMRESRSLRLEDVAAKLGVAPSTLSRIETGAAPTRASYLTVMLDIYSVTDPDRRRHLADIAREGQRKDWWHDNKDLLPPPTPTYLALEAAASEIRSWSLLAIPDLLQTEDYAAAILRATRPGFSRTQFSQLVTITLRRQELLHDGSHQLHAILDESVLLRQVGSSRIMADQLDHLTPAAASSNITLQIATLASPHPSLKCSFTVLSFLDPADPNAAIHHSTTTDHIVTKRDADVRTLRATFATLAASAMSPASSASLIKQLAE